MHQNLFLGFLFCLCIYFNTNTLKLAAQTRDLAIHIACLTEFPELAPRNNIFLDNNNCITPLIIDISTNLEAEGLSVVIDVSPTDGTDYVMYLLTAIHGEPILHFYVEEPSIVLPSPLLYSYPYPDTPFIYGFWAYPNHNDMKTAPEFLTTAILYDTENCDAAVPYLNTVIQESDTTQYSTHWRANFQLGNCALLNGDYDEALAFYDKSEQDFQHDYNEGAVIEIDYDMPAITINTAWILIQQGQAKEAMDLVNSIDIPSLIGSEKVDFLSRRAQLYAISFDYDSAIADMDAVIELAEAHNISDEDLAELYTLRGEIIFLIYEWDRVLENLNIALDLNPEYAPAYFQRGVLYYTMALREEALTDFQHYLELAPDAINAAEAQHYIDSIQIELDTLGG